eukprot:142-Hanusia_phi.AAC.2
MGCREQESRTRKEEERIRDGRTLTGLLPGVGRELGSSELDRRSFSPLQLEAARSSPCSTALR